MEFSTRSIHDLIQEQGDKRVSKNSAKELGKTLETFTGDIAEEALAIAKEDEYQTIRPIHIREALR